VAEEDKPEGMRVALISAGLWQHRFGGDPQVLDEPLRWPGRRIS